MPAGDIRSRFASWGPWILGAVVALSRLLALPDGPWEQDEAIFAAGVLDFSVVRHRPHPPGFPGWIALGKLATPAVGDPLVALRLWSCAASVATFALLGVLLRHRVAQSVAWATAFAHAFVPGVWFHAPRAFTTTPALAVILLAIWLWHRDSGRAVAAGFVAAAFALLIRPQLLPAVGAIVLVALWLHRERRRACFIGLGLGIALGLVTIGVVAFDSGGLDRLLVATTAHFRHNQQAAGFDAIADLGVVRDLGGIASTIATLVAVAVGFAIWWRRDQAAAGVVLAVGLAMTVSVLVLHPAELPRYGIAIVLVTTAPVAVLADALGARLGAVALFAVAAALAWRGHPAVFAVRDRPLPPVAALRSLEAEGPNDRPLVYSHGQFSFVRLEHMCGRLQRPIVDEDDLETRLDRFDAPYDYLGRRRRALPGATAAEEVFDAFPDAAWDLSQRRYHTVTLSRRPVVVERPKRAVEFDGNGEPFVWLTPRSVLRAQPGAVRLELVLLIDPSVAPLGLRAAARDRVLTVMQLQAGLRRVSIDLADCPGACAVQLRFDRELDTGADRRLRSARIYGAWCEGPGFDVPAYTFSPGLPSSAAARGVMLEGFFAPERFTADALPGAWTDGNARARFRAGPGRLEVTLAQPPPRAPDVTLETDAGSWSVQAGAAPTTHTVEVQGRDGWAWLHVEGATRSPAQDNADSADDRSLGPIVLSVRYAPSDNG